MERSGSASARAAAAAAAAATSDNEGFSHGVVIFVVGAEDRGKVRCSLHSLDEHQDGDNKDEQRFYQPVHHGLLICGRQR